MIPGLEKLIGGGTLPAGLPGSFPSSLLGTAPAGFPGTTSGGVSGNMPSLILPGATPQVIPPLNVFPNASAPSTAPASGPASGTDANQVPMQTRQVIPGRFYGTVKSYNGEKGFGFVSCPRTLPIFNRDIFVHRREMERSEAPVGSAVSFFVELNQEGHPQARSMQLLPEVLGQQLGLNNGDGMNLADATGLPVGLGKLKSPGAEGGADGSSNNSLGAQLAATLRLGGGSAEGVREHLKKLFPLGMGGDEAVRNFASQQKAQSEKMMAEFLAMQAKTMGDDAGLDQEAPEEVGRFAAALQLQFQAASAQCSDADPQNNGGGIPSLGALDLDDLGRAKQKTGTFVGHDASRRFHGQISKWLDDQGYGFVRCPETQKVYGKDIFLHKAQIGSEADLYKQRTQMGLQIGNKVAFSVEIQRGMPRAKDVILLELEELEEKERQEKRAAAARRGQGENSPPRTRSPKRWGRS